MSKVSSLIKLAFLVSLLSLYIFVLPVYPSSLTIDHAYIRKVHQFDFGTIHIFLKNSGETSLIIDKISLNDIRLDNLPNKTATWMQILPNPVLPKGVSDVTIRLPKHIENYNFPFQVKIEASSGETIEIPVGKIGGSFKITGVYFNDNLDKAYIYLQNTSKANFKPKKVYFGTEEVTSETKFLSQEVMPGEKGLLIATLKIPLPQGRYLAVKIVNEDGEIAESSVRVFSSFPITSWNGDTRGELHFDSSPFHIPYEFLTKPEKTKELNFHSAWYLLGCPNCTDAQCGNIWGNSANEIIKRAKRCYQADPSRPSHTHVCEAFKEVAYFIYGEVCDIMFINPYQVVFHGKDPRKNGYFAKLAKLACEPRALMTIPEAFYGRETQPYPSPEEERLGVYYQISEGVKGISYFAESSYRKYPELEKEIGRINKELQVLKSYLKIGEPFSNLASSSESKVIANTLCSGDKGVVLILINTDYKTTIKETKRHTDFSPKKDFRVEIKVPKWLNIKRVMEIGREIKDIGYRNEGENIVIPIDGLNLTKAILLTAGEEELL